jgi:hypothetical protein
MPIRARTRAALLLGLLTGLAAACGGSHGPAAGGAKPEADKAALVILRDARKAAHDARSVHVTGSSRNSNVTALDLQLADGRGGRGTATVSGLSFSIIRDGRFTYLRGDAGFTRHFAGSAASLVGRRWFRVPAGRAQFKSFDDLTNMRVLLNTLLAPSSRTLAKLGLSTVDGVRVIGLQDRGHGVLYVAAAGTPYPVEIVSSPAGSGKLVFGRWNRPVALRPPPGAVDLTRLLKQT